MNGTFGVPVHLTRLRTAGLDRLPVCCGGPTMYRPGKFGSLTTSVIMFVVLLCPVYYFIEINIYGAVKHALESFSTIVLAIFVR